MVNTYAGQFLCQSHLLCSLPARISGSVNLTLQLRKSDCMGCSEVHGTMLILSLDDEPVNHMVIEQMVRSQGYDFHEVRTFDQPNAYEDIRIISDLGLLRCLHSGMANLTLVSLQIVQSPLQDSSLCRRCTTLISSHALCTGAGWAVSTGLDSCTARAARPHSAGLHDAQHVRWGIQWHIQCSQALLCFCTST